ncbi:MAG: hypothetical protein WBE72_06235 [Terracidiphilus sp.]
MNADTGQQEAGTGLQAWQHGAIFLLACALLVTRRPDAVFHAQFYGEDGHVWIADAYNLGWWHAILRPWTGYFMTLPRLGAALALLGPLWQTPLVLNVIAIAAQALPVNLLVSARSAAWGSLRFRALMAAMYLALPNCAEINFGITESQWLLALSAFLLIVAAAPKSRAGRILDILFLTLSGLSGPFCIFLAPIAAVLAWKRREPRRWTPVYVLAACSLIQACGLLFVDPAGRPRYAIGASFALLMRIVGGQVVLGTVLGSNRLPFMTGTGVLLFLLGSVIAGAALVAICFWRSALEMKLFLLLAGMLFGASLVSITPAPPAGVTAWQVLAYTDGIRYWFFPILAFAWTLLWCARGKSMALRSIAGVLLCVMCFTVPTGWRVPALKDVHFEQSARRFEAAPAGTIMVIPEDPEGWTLRLVKHSSR